MSPDKCVQSHNHHHGHDTESFCHPQKFPVALCHQSPIPQPLVTIHLLSVVTVLLFLTFFVKGIIQYVFFCVWLSLSMMLLRFTHVFTGIGSSFLFIAE